MRVRVAPLLVCVAALLLPGCQRIADVSGTVRVDGKPAKGLVATTEGDGRYTVRRLGPGAKSGVPVGTYAVKVMADADNPASPKVPASYASGSALSFEVKGSGNVFDIDISSK